MTIADVLLYAALIGAGPGFLFGLIVIGALIAVAVHQFFKWRGMHND